MFDYEKDRWYHSELARLTEEVNKIPLDNKLPFEEFMANSDKRIEILKEMSHLQSEYHEFLLDQLEKAGVDEVQKIINLIFGIRA